MHSFALKSDLLIVDNKEPSEVADDKSNYVPAWHVKKKDYSYDANKVKRYVINT